MRRGVASFVALAIAGVVTGGPAAAVAADSDPVDVIPGANVVNVEDGQAIYATDDALLVLAVDTEPANGWRDSVLFTRSLDQDASTVTLGESTRIARASGFTLAEHDGTVAYLRRVDGRLVLRAPDGSESLPTWGGNPDLVANGPEAMSTTWLASAGGMLYNRTTGASYDLLALPTDIPVDHGRGLWSVTVSDDRVIWTEESWTPDVGGSVRMGTYTAALGSSGPQGPATLLGDNEGTGELQYQLGLIGNRLVWAQAHQDWDPMTGTSFNLTVSSVPADTPAAVPLERTFTGTGYFTALSAGDTVGVFSTNGDAVWIDPADPDVDVRTSPFPGFANPRMSAGAILVFDFYDSEYGRLALLIDTAGRTVTADPTVPPAPPGFTDVSLSNIFAGNIAWLTDLGITRGYPDGTFRPTGTVNRAAMAAFLYRFAGEPDFTAPATSPFRDVATSHPFYREIAWLAEAGISTGTVTASGAYFKPTDNVSRAAMAAFLYRFAGEPDWTVSPTSPFNDVAPSHPFYEAIFWLADTGISTGTTTPSGTYFKPGDSVSRQAMAAFLSRIHMSGWTLNWSAA